MDRVPKPVSLADVMEKYPVMYEESMNTVLVQEVGGGGGREGVVFVCVDVDVCKGMVVCVTVCVCVLTICIVHLHLYLATFLRNCS